jgi:hypothetical protein
MPENSQPTSLSAEIDEVAIVVQGGTQPGPDGRPWTVLMLQTGITAIQLLMPPKTAEILPGLITKILETANANTRRARLGLILPPMTPDPTNGHRP